MKKTVLVLILISFGLCASAQAAVVYLKNGRVMTGRIVEKTPDYIVLKTGEGESAVRVTIFLEDINRMESEEDYSEKTKFIPFELFEQNRSEPEAPPQIGSSENVRKFLEESRKFEPSVNIEGQMTQTAPFERGLSFPFARAAGAGTSSVSGIVRLPEDIPKAKGDLYVYLMKDAGGGRFMASPPVLYQKIAGDLISGRQVDYVITGVPSGTYKVFAQWDISAPFVETKTVTSGVILRNLGVKGDYTGSAQEPVVLAVGEERYNVNFDCTTYLVSSRIDLSSAEKPDFSIIDLIYSRPSPMEEKFFLVIKNNMEIPCGPLLFHIWVNDEKISPAPVAAGSLMPGEEKEVDITPVYAAFKKEKEIKGPKHREPSKVLKFKITWYKTEEVEFEKTVVVFQ